MQIRMIACFAAALGVACLVLPGCSKSEDPGVPGAGAGGGSSETAWRLADMPADALSVAEVKRTAVEGDHVVVRGRIGGTVKPMSADSAVFVMMDSAIPSCADMGDAGHCPTPWDYCCETPESKQANNATVQLVDASGKALTLDLSGEGLSPLDEVVVVGTVGPRPTEGVLVIKAEKIHRVQG